MFRRNNNRQLAMLLCHALPTGVRNAMESAAEEAEEERSSLKSKVKEASETGSATVSYVETSNELFATPLQGGVAISTKHSTENKTIDIDDAPSNIPQQHRIIADAKSLAESALHKVVVESIGTKRCSAIQGGVFFR